MAYYILAGYPLHGPGVGWVKFFFIFFWTVHDISRTFDFFDPPKIPTATPFGGGEGGRGILFAFKDTISRHFAGYASVALETIWLHEPRDVIFLGPLMTLLCLSRYSGMGEVLFTHADCRRM